MLLNAATATSAVFEDGLRMDRTASGALRQGNTEPCIPGGESQGGKVARPFRGLIDHAALWNRALTDDEVILLSGGKEPVEARRAEMDSAERTRREHAADEHRELLKKADASVAEAAPKAREDPLRPLYHLTTAANWINDPNGPIYFDGAYHMFFQHNPYGDNWGNMSWAHAVSKDLAHWEHWPIALTPNPDSYDAGGIFSGCCVIDDAGVPTIVYTGVNPEVQCIATSADGMRTWTKYEGNPVIPQRPRNDLQGFRDPCVWKEDDGWHMVIGSGLNGQGGTALLYRSLDLRLWEYLGPLCVGFAKNWECPGFFPLGDKHVLFVSPHGPVKYAVGEYQDHHFTPGEWRPMNLGEGTFYAPNTLLDPQGRRILWGWITGGGSPDHPWNGCLTLPRVLTLRDDLRLGIAPAPELELLRGNHWSFNDITLSPDSENPFAEVQGNSLEILAEIEPANADAAGIEVLRSPDGEEKTVILFDNVHLRLEVGDQTGDFQILPGEDTLKLHIFVDRSVIEVYANNREALVCRAYPKRPDSLGVRLITQGETARFRKVDVWTVNSIWR
jgi:beta-fructofuranosidase